MSRSTIRKFFYAVFFLVIFFSYSLALGDPLKRAISFPKETNGRELMQTAVSEGKNHGYVPKREEGKVVLTKKMPARHSVPPVKIYQITLSIAPGEEGRKVLTLEGEYIGHIQDREILVCFECDIDKIEKAVKEKLETK